MPETQVHFELRVLLYQLLCDHLGLEATVGSDQFVYYDAADPSRCVAPDIYVQLKAPAGKIRSWKVWERGAPDVAVEVVSPSDAPQTPWAEKLARYQSMGVRELVRFAPEARPGEPLLRVWDRVDGALLERELDAGPCQCRSSVMDIRWVVAVADDQAIALRFTAGLDSEVLVLTRREARQAEAEAREAEAEARSAAEQRVRELEAELRRGS